MKKQQLYSGEAKVSQQTIHKAISVIGDKYLPAMSLIGEKYIEALKFVAYSNNTKIR